MANDMTLPLSARAGFIPLPSDPSAITDEQRALAFPGMATVCVRIGRAFIEASSHDADTPVMEQAS